MAIGQKTNSGAKPMPVPRLTCPQLREKSGCFEEGLNKMTHGSNTNHPPKFSQKFQTFNRITDTQEKKKKLKVSKHFGSLWYCFWIDTNIWTFAFYQVCIEWRFWWLKESWFDSFSGSNGATDSFHGYCFISRM